MTSGKTTRYTEDMFDVIFWWDTLSLLLILFPDRKYAEESYYWRFTGIILILLLLCNWLFSSYLTPNLNLILYVVLVVYLFIHSIMRYIIEMEENN